MALRNVTPKEYSIKTFNTEKALLWSAEAFTLVARTEVFASTDHKSAIC